MEKKFSASKYTLLLADDSVTIQKVVNLTFADEGIEVITVGDGDAAMEKFNAVTPDLVLADVNMPGLDGYRICEKIKQNAETKHIPVILLVGSFEPFSEEEARRVGADDFLTKPFQSIRQLVDKVSDLLDSKSDEEVFASLDSSAAVQVNSFDDTLKMPAHDEFADDLGDSGMDDEMIQTSQIGSLPIDEAKKFESVPVNEFSAEDIDLNALKQPYNSDISTEKFESEKDWAQTQPLSREEMEEISGVASRTETVENSDESDEGFEFQKDSSNEAARNYPPPDSQTFSSSPITADLDFDDFNLLDFPQSGEKEDFYQINARTNSGYSSKTNEISGKQIENLSSPALSENLSPATIEAIADKIVEKISGRIVKEIVREIIAEMEKK